MKLRFKKTGEIVELEPLEIFNANGNLNLGDAWYNSIKDFVADWEDAPEEPKGCWIINIFGIVEYTHFRNKAEAELLKEIGNYFETEEEAEEAVKKLKAWQRLEDKGFRFDGIDFFNRAVKFKVPSSFFNGEENIFVSGQSEADLRFLFGGEE